MSALVLRSRQRVMRLNLRLLRQVTESALTQLLDVESYDLGIHIVAAPEMIRLNESFLHHAGSTDVITFNYANHVFPTPLHGDIFICVDEAIIQSRRFRTTWQTEIVRYLVHGLLHLRGHDDARPAARRKMKREEERLLRELIRRFPLSKLSRKPKVAA
jgi:probable rRNA maturation factor